VSEVPNRAAYVVKEKRGEVLVFKREELSKRMSPRGTDEEQILPGV